MVTGLIVLRACGMDGGTFFGVEGAVLNGRLIGHAAHHPAQRIDFLDELAFGHAADGGAAGHGRHLVQIDHRQGHLAAHACGRQGGLAAGMTGTHNNDIEFSRVIRHRFVVTDPKSSQAARTYDADPNLQWLPAPG